ncbi:DUF58 domain-containing protein [Zavarzinella formosa]|uniref:DUF58 domain-containing protein n=1 Tax=Zavarzinella formosa TaxID=360055 RepID=UPI000310AFCF|nr:DUF58 domain-containing protein [Zavarzinella formosa]
MPRTKPQNSAAWNVTEIAPVFQPGNDAMVLKARSIATKQQHPADSSVMRRLATHDLFPEFSARFRRVFYNPLGVLLAAVSAALACGLFLHPQGFVLAGSLALVILLGVVWPWVSLRGISTKLGFDRTRAVEGEPVVVRLTLRNHLPWAAWGLAIRDGFEAKDSESPVATIANAPPRRTGSCRWEFIPACRGSYPLRVPSLTTGFPFGLWESKRSISVENSLIVWPKTMPVGPVPADNRDEACDGNVSRNKVGGHGDVTGVRPYRRGDSPRRIHWAQSAKHDRLIVCELQSMARPVIQLILDADPASHAGAGPDGSREWAIRIVASMAKGWLESGAKVGVSWAGTEIMPASGSGQLTRMMDALAAVPDTVSETLNHVLSCPACHKSRDGVQIVVTTEAGLTTLAGASSGSHRFVILQRAGFAGGADRETEPALPIRPWLLIENAGQISSRLRDGWGEARHGS